MTEHGHSVGGDVHVALQGADPDLEGAREGRERVLGGEAGTTAVGLQVERQLTHSLSWRTSAGLSSLAGVICRLVTPDSRKASIRSLT